VKRLLFVLGTRPEAIKLAPVILAARQAPDRFDVTVCATGQHREMTRQMLGVFNIVPDVDLDLMRPDQSLVDISSRLLKGFGDYLSDHPADWVLVQGDTTTVWTAAVASFFLRTPVGHIEAGLRTDDRHQPFPEETNRRIATTVADAHFAPTEWARNNLLAEGVPATRISITGNTIVDALGWILDAIDRVPGPDVVAMREWHAREVGSRPMVLVTGHRRESFGEGFRNICGAIHDLAQSHPEAAFVYPVHLNPNVQQPVRTLLSGLGNVHLLPPLAYPVFAWLMRASTFLLTDSGGVQEEAPSLGKPVLLMRNVTERPEGVEAGVTRLVGTDRHRIIEAAEGLLAAGSRDRPVSNPYGDGLASRRILEWLHAHGPE